MVRTLPWIFHTISFGDIRPHSSPETTDASLPWVARCHESLSFQRQGQGVSVEIKEENIPFYAPFLRKHKWFLVELVYM